MYPKDNIFNIYYEIGKRVPFQVKRNNVGFKGYFDMEYRYSTKGITYMVERVVPKGEYGYAFGYLLKDGVRDDELHQKYNYGKTNGSITCAGCGEWCLIDIPGLSKEEVSRFQDAKDNCHNTFQQTGDPRPTVKIIQPDDEMPFGKYKGKKLREVAEQDPAYINWAINNVSNNQLKLS